WHQFGGDRYQARGRGQPQPGAGPRPCGTRLHLLGRAARALESGQTGANGETKAGFGRASAVGETGLRDQRLQHLVLDLPQSRCRAGQSEISENTPMLTCAEELLL